ncbi:hypothetical protein [Streptomyces sp. NPDC048473]|uniref:hypothetical protein n=1 Tax=unclassified Streptomyces TaxID=2593676 RepID=UPI003722BDB6
MSATLWAVVGLARLIQGPVGSTFEKPVLASVAVLGSLAVGAVLGVATGGVLAVAPQRLVASTPVRGLACFVLGTTLSAGEVVVMAVSSDGGYGPIGLAVSAMPAVGAVTAARSRSIAAARLRSAARA